MKPEKIQRFRALRALAKHPQTPQHERESALRILAKLRAEYPGIEQAADIVDQAEREAAQPGWTGGAGTQAGAGTGAASGQPRPPPRKRRRAPSPQAPAQAPEPSPPPPGVEWRAKFTSWVRDFVSQVGQGLSISTLAENEVGIQVQERPQTIIIQAKISEHTLRRAAYLANDDLTDFFRAVGDLVAQELIDRYTDADD